MAQHVIYYLIILLLSMLPALFNATDCGRRRGYCPVGLDCNRNNSLCENPQTQCTNRTDNDQDIDTTVTFTQPEINANESAGSVQLSLVLSKAINCCTVSILVTCGNINANGGIDYGSPSSPHIPVIFSADVEVVTFDIPIIDDNILEENETFRVTINPDSLPLGLTLGSINETTVTIVDDECNTTTISFKQSAYTVNENDGSTHLVLVLSNPSSTDIIVQVNESNHNASGRLDYKFGLHGVTFLAEMTVVTFDVNIIDDDIFEGSEIFSLHIISSLLPSCVICGDACSATVTIMDNETPITVFFSQSVYSVAEHNGSIQPSLFLSKPSPCHITIHVSTRDITAIGDIDYDSMQYTVSFPAGVTCALFNILIHDDTVLESDETFQIGIVEYLLPYGVNTTGQSGKATVIIEDNDIYISFIQSTYQLYEGNETVCPTLVLSEPASTNITIKVSDSSDSAAGGVDYYSGPYVVNFAKGDSLAKFCVGVIDDNSLENDENISLKIDISSLPSYVIASNPDEANITIIDNEYTFCFDKPSYLFPESVGIAKLIVRLSRPLADDILVHFRYVDLTAFGITSSLPGSKGLLSKDILSPAILDANKGNETANGDLDYYTQFSWPYCATVKKGSLYFLLNIPVIDDAKIEDYELFRIYVDSPSIPDGHAYCSTDFIIINNDYCRINFKKRTYFIDGEYYPETPMLELTCPPLNENTAEHILPITAVVDEVSITATGGWTKSNEVDYLYQNYTCKFVNGNETKSLILRPINDNIVESDETYNLTVKRVYSNYAIIGENSTTTITISNDDVCNLIITQVNGEDYLYFSKPLATNVTIDITYSGNQHNIATFTAEEIKNKRSVPLAIPKSRIDNIEVLVPVMLRSKLPNNVRPLSIQNLITVRYV